MVTALSLAVLISQIPVSTAGVTPEGSTTGPLRVALPPARTVGTVPARVLAAFELSLTKEVAKVHGVRATGPGELADVLSSQLQGSVRGCGQDPECLARVAMAAGEDEFLSTEVALEGTSYSVTLRRVPVRDDVAGRTETRKVKRGDGGELLSLIGPAVRDLYPERGLKQGRVRGVEREAFQRLNPPPIPRWAFWTTAGAGLAAAAGGVTYGLMAKDARDQFQSLAELSATTPISGAELVALERRIDSRAKTANIFFAASAVLGVAAGVEAFFTDWHGYRSSLRVQPTPGGAALAAGGTF